MAQVRVQDCYRDCGDNLRLHATHPKEDLKLIAGEIGEHEDLRDPSKPEQDTYAVVKIDSRNGSSQGWIGAKGGAPGETAHLLSGSEHLSAT